MMDRRGIRSWVAVLALLAAACGPGEQAPGTGATSAETTPAPSQARPNLPPASVLVIHRVADYEAWKAAFDDGMQARKEASCLGHYLKRGVDDPDRVYVYCLATDADRLRSFLESDDLAEAMRNAGVEGEPRFLTMKPMTRNLVPAQRLPGIIVIHTVEDYDRWRVAYDGFDDFRRESGIVGHAVTRMSTDPNQVVVYHQANDVADLRAFVESTELREAMRRGGVVGDPEIHFIQVVGFADY